MYSPKLCRAISSNTSRAEPYPRPVPHSFNIRIGAEVSPRTPWWVVSASRHRDPDRKVTHALSTSRGTGAVWPGHEWCTLRWPPALLVPCAIPCRSRTRCRRSLFSRAVEVSRAVWESAAAWPPSTSESLRSTGDRRRPPPWQHCTFPQGTLHPSGFLGGVPCKYCLLHSDAARIFAALTAREITSTGATVVESRAGAVLRACPHIPRTSSARQGRASRS